MKKLFPLYLACIFLTTQPILSNFNYPEPEDIERILEEASKDNSNSVFNITIPKEVTDILTSEPVVKAAKNATSMVLSMAIIAILQKSIDYFSAKKAIQPRLNFNDVIGLDSAKTELRDFINYLKNPEKYKNMGARCPKGILLSGEPGNGKTLLATALAGEIDCPFYSISGSEISSHMYIGQAAKEIQKIFKNAQPNKPVVIFIDELDSVGMARTNSGNNPAAEQNSNNTLNELLIQLDRLEKENIPTLVIGATNHPEWLDKALIRPGRFDRTIHIGKPTLCDRKKLVEYYSQKLKLADDFNFEKAAEMTSGFSGAEIATLVNQASLIALRKNCDKITTDHLDEARDITIMGLTSNIQLSDEESLKTSYHEAGHTLVSILANHPYKLYKVTRQPRGNSLGCTYYLPQEKYNFNKEEMLSMIRTCFGGRIAEEIFFGEVSTGASNDLEQATQIAKELIATYGMGDNNLQVLNKDELLFDKQAKKQVQEILNTCYQEAKDILQNNKNLLEKIALAINEKETLSKEEVAEIISNF